MVKMYFKDNKEICFKYYIFDSSKVKEFIKELKSKNIMIKNINKRKYGNIKVRNNSLFLYKKRVL